MDAFTMVIVACVAGEPRCIASHVSELAFTTVEACEARIDDIAATMTREFGRREDFRGRQVSYDVSCMDRRQLQQKLGIAQADT